VSADELPGVELAPEGSVLRFLGGPLDGRVDVREARHGAPLPTVTHVHLHGGPKVVHCYDLQSLDDGAAVYQLRRPLRDVLGDEAVTG